jgi:hypothetical protein
MSVIEVGIKTLYQSEGIQASEWLKEPVKGLKTYEAPQMRSGLNMVRESESLRKAIGGLIYFTNHSNCPQQNDIVFLIPYGSSNATGLSVIEGEGWRRSIALYSARKLSDRTWINDKDEYLVPSVYSNTEK